MERCSNLACLICYPLRTKTGQVLTEEALEALVLEAECGYDLTCLQTKTGQVLTEEALVLEAERGYDVGGA